MKASTGSARTGGSVDTAPTATVRPEPVEGLSFPDRPYHHLNALPRELWRWAVVCSSGPATRRLPELAHWESALMGGTLPDPAHDFGDAAATQALRPLLAELDLLTLTRQSAPLTRQVLQSLLWHLDSLIDRPADEPRDDAIARMRSEFRDSWDVQRQGWDEVLALLQSLGDLAHLRWDDLAGQLNRREWQEARRIGQLLQRLPALASFIDGVGRRGRFRRVEDPAHHQAHGTCGAVAITQELGFIRHAHGLGIRRHPRDELTHDSGLDAAFAHEHEPVL